MPPTATDPRARGETPTAVLRLWALKRPFVQILVDHLPRIPRGSRENIDPGLYVDVHGADWSASKGEVRVSVARIYSALENGECLLMGQLHVTSRPAMDGTEERRVRYYVHTLGSPTIEEHWTEDEWWLSILDRHYHLGGPPVDLGPGCEA